MAPADPIPPPPIPPSRLIIRGARVENLLALVALERLSFERPRGEQWLRSWNRKPDHYLATILLREDAPFWSHALAPSERVIGYFAFRAENYAVRLARLAVHPHFRRRGVGRAALDNLSSAIVRHNRISAIVRETDLAAQLFFRACSWRCASTWPGRFGREDGLYFVRWPRRPAEAKAPA